ncbi:SDR family NAD(P)-dependent oxidoreductase [Novipirellula rosea]|uniref:SDR family oxidoreductase n=1 Tax=Novipirellula rosea TaxID=1031540 RepID=A0ABP8NWK8_9BACT
MHIRFENKTAVVTGSTAGIGYAIAKGLAAAGADVVINGRSQSRVDEAIKKLEGELKELDRGDRGSIRGVAADLATVDGYKRFVAEVPQADILINNLGIFAPKPFFEIPDEDWERFFQTNVMSAIRMSRHYTPGMVDRGWGRVQFLSSESAIAIPTEMIHYGMTKTALLSISRGLAATVAATGVTVNAILPGPTASEGVSQFVDDLARDGNKSRDQVETEFFEQVRPTSLIQRFETVDEIANMCVFVASEQASAITGAALRVDGGTVNAII